MEPCDLQHMEPTITELEETNGEKGGESNVKHWQYY